MLLIRHKVCVTYFYDPKEYWVAFHVITHASFIPLIIYAYLSVNSKITKLLCDFFITILVQDIFDRTVHDIQGYTWDDAVTIVIFSLILLWTLFDINSKIKRLYAQWTTKKKYSKQ